MIDRTLNCSHAELAEWLAHSRPPAACFINPAQRRFRGLHISHELQLLIDSGDADALAALSDHTADTDGWDDDFLPGYASGASDDGDLF